VTVVIKSVPFLTSVPVGVPVGAAGKPVESTQANGRSNRTDGRSMRALGEGIGELAVVGQLKIVAVRA